MPTDSEILTRLEAEAFNLDLNNDEIATLLKYAAIAKCLEAGTHAVVPVEPTEAMVHAVVEEMIDVLKLETNWADDSCCATNALKSAYAAAPAFPGE